MRDRNIKHDCKDLQYEHHCQNVVLLINKGLLHQALLTTCAQKLNDSGQNQEKEAGMCTIYILSVTVQKENSGINLIGILQSPRSNYLLYKSTSPD